jgi:uncharacterized membrane protein YeaQ/YmgE (transglycosylase-associated protein family)
LNEFNQWEFLLELMGILMGIIMGINGNFNGNYIIGFYDFMVVSED